MLGFLLCGNISTERILGLSGRDENEACEWSRPSIESQTNEDEIDDYKGYKEIATQKDFDAF